MHYHSCVPILGHTEPQNWLNPSVERGCIPPYVAKEWFWDNKRNLTF